MSPLPEYEKIPQGNCFRDLYPDRRTLMMLESIKQAALEGKVRQLDQRFVCTDKLLGVQIASDEGIIIEGPYRHTFFNIGNIAPSFDWHYKKGSIPDYWNGFGIHPDLDKENKLLTLTYTGQKQKDTNEVRLTLASTKYAQGHWDIAGTLCLNSAQREIVAALILLPPQLLEEARQRGVIVSDKLSSGLDHFTLALPANLLPDKGLSAGREMLYPMDQYGNWYDVRQLLNTGIIPNLNPVSLIY